MVEARKSKLIDPETEAPLVNVARSTHEYCNLVQVMTGYLEMLAARTEDKISLQYIENVQAAVHKLSELAGDIEAHNG